MINAPGSGITVCVTAGHPYVCSVVDFRHEVLYPAFMKTVSLRGSGFISLALKPSSIHFVLPPLVSDAGVGVTRLKPIIRVPGKHLCWFRRCRDQRNIQGTVLSPDPSAKLTFRLLSEPVAFQSLLILSAFFRSVPQNKITACCIQFIHRPGTESTVSFRTDTAVSMVKLMDMESPPRSTVHYAY